MKKNWGIQFGLYFLQERATNLPIESVNENIVINVMKNNEQCSFENASEILTASLKETSCIFVSSGWLCSAPLFELF